MDTNEQNSLPGSSFVRGNLQNLHELQVWVVGGSQNTYNGYSEWFPHAPALRNLSVLGRLSGTNHFGGWTPPLGASPVKLRFISFTDLDLSSFAIDDATSLFDLSYLEILAFRNCTGGQPVLRSLAKGYRRFSGSALKQITYKTPVISGAVCIALEELFESIDSLVDLTLGYVPNRMPDLKSLTRNGKSLKQLDIYASDDGRVYSASDLEHLASYCTRLRKIQMSLGDLNPTNDDLDQFEGCNLTAFEGLEDRLVSSTLIKYYITFSHETQEVLAKHPTLNQLVLTSRPLLPGDSSAGERQWRYAQVAEKIMAHLNKYGSKISFSLLGFKPAGAVQYAEEADGDGHMWPIYHYKKGVVMVNIGKRSEFKTTAMPYSKRAHGW